MLGREATKLMKEAANGTVEEQLLYVQNATQIRNFALDRYDTNFLRFGVDLETKLK